MLSGCINHYWVGEVCILEHNLEKKKMWSKRILLLSQWLTDSMSASVSPTNPPSGGLEDAVMLADLILSPAFNQGLNAV